MLDSGRWELGGHTRTHANLKSLDQREVIDEIRAVADLSTGRNELSSPTFAYPFGIYSAEHAKLVRDAGFIGAMTTDPGIAVHPYSKPFEVPRIKVSGKDNLFAFWLRMRSGKRGLES